MSGRHDSSSLRLKWIVYDIAIVLNRLQKTGKKHLI